MNDHIMRKWSSIKHITGAPNGSVPQNICSYGMSCWLARKKGTDKFTFDNISDNL